MFIIVVYWASGLLPDIGSFFAYLIVTLLGTLTAQSLGYFFGATLLNVQKSICKYLSLLLFCRFLKDNN